MTGSLPWLHIECAAFANSIGYRLTMMNETPPDPMPKPIQQSFAELRTQMPLAFPGQRVGLMGGTFNPPHEGHAVCAVTALRRLELDQLWWMVTPGNPLKGHDGLPSLAERMAASRRLAADPRIKVTGFEAALGTPYTYETLRYVTRRLPGVDFVWVMGADNLAGFHRWQRWRDIARLVPMAVVDRPGWRLKALASPAALGLARYRVPETLAGNLPTLAPPAWALLSTRLSEASSTALRAKSDR
jgi:nicotinate-nucleotide adenylyltransferase